MVQTPLRMMVAGDKSSAGKSTISLGLLVALLDAGFLPHEVAYIKPATQCVTSTLVARFCEEQGIACEHIGPVVYYRGFTRQQLDDPSEHNALVAQCSEAVDRISTGKKITLIDGVGYPSVGSIVGCSSADLAVACASPVLLVGKPGVGDAVDSFNLCARYFEAQAVPVLGSADAYAPGPPLGTYRLRLPASRVGLPPGPRVLYVLGTRTSLGSTVRTASRGTPGARRHIQPALALGLLLARDVPQIPAQVHGRLAPTAARLRHAAHARDPRRTGCRGGVRPLV